MSVPKFNDLSFYSNPKAHNSRYADLVASFMANFPNDEIEFFARSPGRVNLIGDHIDYNYFPVLPMAIEVDVVAAVSTNEKGVIAISNTDAAKFPKETVAIGKDSGFAIDKEHHTWANYFKCGLIVAAKFLEERSGEGKHKLKGMNITFSGTVPTGGGLSSSAAFCVASTLAVLYANGIENISKADLTRITVVSEHYLGLNNGGMDQCASVYGEQGKALFIQFKPQLKGTPFEFPAKNLTFVITNSLQVSNKYETAPIHYNLRVVEMAIAGDLLAKKLGVEGKPGIAKDSNVDTYSLRGVMDGYCGEWDGENLEKGIANMSKMIDVVEKILSEKKGYTVKQCCQELGITPKDFHSRYLKKIPVKFDVLKLYQRSLHVYRESLRVLQTLQLLSTPIDDDAKFFQTFGSLMNESQHDLDVLNESSNAKLNEVCSIALKNGAYGSRVTGAGWGGSIVHLTSTENLQKLTNSLIDAYYKREFPGIKEEEIQEAVIDSKPATGSCLVSADIVNKLV
ncbi:Gal1 galactokinase [Candida orthopsilosis Co 90-125]|uniref:Galactokinase n=1 Tax=Candida orthopsilosis (strain 90-125) TaxID=1136231 RepID=H8X1N8_CANO9|nr:Gal1 galactokinase [Candida orthopsilosis Co 90-125]CCG22443.1 Gal1 galactokinase [Candida orthopsilosis Co 90-125]